MTRGTMAGMDAQPAGVKGRGKARSLLLSLPWILIGIVAVVAVSYWHWLSVPRMTVARFNACVESAQETKKNAKGQLDMQDIRACEKQMDASVEDLVKAPIDELKWTLEIIGSLAAFFVIAQGAAAYFSATSYTSQADKSVADMGKALSGMKDTAKAIDKIQQGSCTGCSQVFILIDPRKLGGETFTDQVADSVIDYLHGSAIAENGTEVLYPGESALRNRNEQFAKGIAVDDGVWKEVLALAERKK